MSSVKVTPKNFYSLLVERAQELKNRVGDSAQVSLFKDPLHPGEWSLVISPAFHGEPDLQYNMWLSQDGKGNYVPEFIRVYNR